MRRTGGSSPHGHSGLGCTNTERAAPGLQPRRHGPPSTRTAGSTHCTVCPWRSGCATTPQCGTVRARGGAVRGQAGWGMPAFPALPRCSAGHPGRGPHLGALTMRCHSRSAATLVRRTCVGRVRPAIEGAPPGLQLWGLSGPVPGRRAGPKLRARGPPRAPRMHLCSCYTAEAGYKPSLPPLRE